MDARGQLGCDLWSAEGSCKFQTSFRPMYSQGSNFQHIIKHPSHSSALCRRSVSTNQDRSFFSIIYSQKYFLIENEHVDFYSPSAAFWSFKVVSKWFQTPEWDLVNPRTCEMTNSIRYLSRAGTSTFPIFLKVVPSIRWNLYISKSIS